MTSQRTAFDRVLTALLVSVAFLLAYYAALPGIRQELSPRAPHGVTSAGQSGTGANALAVRDVPPISQFELVGIPHNHASGWGQWCLLGAIAALLFVGFWERPTMWHIFGFYLVAAACCPLWASRWEGEVAVASALRWASAALLVAGSIPIWLRGSLRRIAARWSPRLGRPWWHRSSAEAPAAVFALALAPPALMAVFIGASAALRVDHDPSTITLVQILVGVFVVAGGVGVALRSIEMPAGSATRGIEPVGWLRQISSLLLVLGTAPLLALMLYVVGSALQQTPILGPDPGSLFVRMGSASSHAVPLLTLALVLVGYALRERSSAFAFAGGLTFNLAITAGYLLLISKQGLRFDAAGWIRLAQLNAIVSALYALAWMGILRWKSQREHESARGPLNPLLLTTLGLAAALLLLVTVPIWAHFAFEELDVSLVSLVASPAGWVSTVLVIVALVWAWRWSLQGRAVDRTSIGGLCAGLFVLGVMAACTAARWDSGNGLAFHTLLVIQMAIAWVVWMIARHGVVSSPVDPSAENQPPIDTVEASTGDSSTVDATTLERLGAAGWQGRRFERVKVGWVVLFATLALILSLRAMFDGPGHPWWGIAGLISLAGLAITVAYANVQRGLLFVAMALVNLAVSAWWLMGAAPWMWGTGARPFVMLIEFNVIALALPAVAWVYLELSRFRPLATRRTPVAHRFAARASLVVMGLLVALGLAADLLRQGPPEFAWLDWCALVATAIAVAAGLWDAESHDSVAGLYLLGLVAAGLLLDQLNLDPHWLVWTGTIVLAAYTVLTSYLWNIRRQLSAAAARWRIPVGSQSPLAGLAWLVPANSLLVTAVVVLVYLIELTYPEFSMRLLAGQAALAQVISIALLAHGARRSGLQYAALALGVVALTAFGWAWLDPTAIALGHWSATSAVLSRLIVVAAALAGCVILYGFGPARILSDENEWRRAASRLLPVLVTLTVFSLVGVVSIELTAMFQRTEIVLAWPGIVAVVAILLGLAIAAVVAAVLPGHDPFELSQAGRTAYVYAAEVFLGMLCIHIRVTMPWLFHGFFQRWWPLVVMAIAFVGVGLSEFFDRRRLKVLAGPLENTSAILPLLPALGFWLVPTGVDYSLLLVVIGALYAVLSGTRRSFGFGLLAALSANAALWFFLQRHAGYRLLEHPQLWLIPPALCVLAAAYLHRSQLTAGQLAAVRYGTSIVVYVSSTADIFIHGVGQAPWLPLVLAGFSILGILVGIWLRVRAFLFLGTAFLLVALLTVIWYAAVDLHQTWLWWAMGIVTGILIIALFAVFEKKRDDILKMVEDLKHWQA